MSAPEVDELTHYFPVDAVIRDGKPQIEWLRMPNPEFREPFFDQTIEQARHGNPAQESLFTDPDALLQVAKAAPPVQPSGFILHTSRCGSTLVANACRALESARVIAEAPVIDKLVSRLFTDAEPGSSKELVYLSLIRAAVQSFTRHQSSAGRLFVKFSCASILQIKPLRRAWPNVPFLILFRDPVEVTVSNLRSRPQWMTSDSNPGAAAAIVGVAVNQLDSMTDEEFCARALGRYYAAAESVATDRATRVFDYNQLSLQTIREIIEFFGVTPSEQETAAIERSLLSYSKDPVRTFQPDSADKKGAASVQVIEAVERFALRDYERLRLLSQATGLR